jgi:hypothetical protein
MALLLIFARPCIVSATCSHQPVTGLVRNGYTLVGSPLQPGPCFSLVSVYPPPQLASVSVWKITLDPAPHTHKNAKLAVLKQVPFFLHHSPRSPGSPGSPGSPEVRHTRSTAVPTQPVVSSLSQTLVRVWSKALMGLWLQGRLPQVPPRGCTIIAL